MNLPGAFSILDHKSVSHAVGLSLLSSARLRSISACMEKTRGVEGDTAEAGIVSGGTSRLIAAANGGRTHWACDTFDGLADVGRYDGDLTNKMFHNSLGDVTAELADLRNIILVPGYFPESAPAAMKTRRFSFVHIDVDTYLSILGCFVFFAARMGKGGVIAIDDVLDDGSGCPGACRAWREISVRNKGEWVVLSKTPPQVAVRFEGGMP